MLRAGLPVLNTLEMLEKQTTAKGMKKIIETIKKDLESGNALSKCFEKHSKVFDTVVVNLIKAGEASGKLDVFLNKIVTNLEKKEKIKSQIKVLFLSWRSFNSGSWCNSIYAYECSANICRNVRRYGDGR